MMADHLAPNSAVVPPGVKPSDEALTSTLPSPRQLRSRSLTSAKQVATSYVLRAVRLRAEAESPAHR
jgi:hypothetical protein